MLKYIILIVNIELILCRYVLTFLGKRPENLPSFLPDTTNNTSIISLLTRPGQVPELVVSTNALRRVNRQFTSISQSLIRIVDDL